MSARLKAERCFALARSTTFAGEREAAIARGLAICVKAGLSPSLFNIPGRERGSSRPASGEEQLSGTRTEWRRGDRAPEHYDRQEVRDVMRRFRETLADQERAAAARADETVYDARRRNFDEACAAANARDAAR